MDAIPAPPLEAACEVKFTALSLKEVSQDGVFEGYASLFNREDLGRDIVAPGEARALMRDGLKGLQPRRDAGRGSAWEARLLAQMAEAARLLRQPLNFNLRGL